MGEWEVDSVYRSRAAAERARVQFEMQNEAAGEFEDWDYHIIEKEVLE